MRFDKIMSEYYGIKLAYFKDTVINSQSDKKK